MSLSKLLKKIVIPTEQSAILTTVTNNNDNSSSFLPLIEKRSSSKTSQRLSKYSNTALFENHIQRQIDELSLRKNSNIYLTESSQLTKKNAIQPNRKETEQCLTEVNENNLEVTKDNNNETSLLNKLSKRQIRYQALVGQSQSPPNRSRVTPNNQLDRKKEMSIREYLVKTREINQMKYSLELKKERALRINEYYNNEIETINMTMKSMEESRKLFDENFCVKFSEYNKKLSIELDKERVSASALYQKVINLRKEINQLDMRINKKKNDKESIERWVIFQRQVNDLHPSSSSVILNQTNKNDDPSSIRIPLIYSTPEEFISVLHNGETTSRLLLDNLNAINSTIQYFKKEKEEVEVYNIQSTREEIRLIKEKEIILGKVKNENNVFMKEYRSVLALLKESNFIKLMKAKVRASIIPKASVPNSKLKKKIDELYATTKGLLLDEDPDEVLIKAKKNWSLEKTLLYKLAQTEKAINIILKHYSYYDAHQDIYGSLLKSIYVKIELQHKEQAAKRAKEDSANKLALLKDKIEERNNKVYFLPLRRVDMYPINVSSNENKKTKTITKKKELEFEDFMFDINN